MTTLYSRPALKSLLLVGALAASVWTAAPARALELHLVPGATSVTEGSLFDLELRISGLGAGTAPTLGAYDLNVSFDPTLVRLNGGTMGDPTLGDPLNAGAGSDTGFAAGSLAGLVNLYGVSYDAPADLESYQAGEFTLAILRFEALKAGSAPFSYGSVLLGDADGNELAADLLGSARVAISRVPTHTVPDGGLPSSAGMLLASVLVFGVFRSTRH